VAGAVDISLLVERTAGFSPADIEYAAQKASQAAFEKAIARSGDDIAGEGLLDGPHTEDYLEAIETTRPTVSPEVAAEFLEDIELLARV
jgi:transitional endoplasmic reticulum ATPase